jgi:transcriptional regulator GlxA family with amidase domain
MVGLGVAIAALFGLSAFSGAEEPAEAIRPLTLGVVLYPGFELLDVFGPVEMFLAVGPERMRVVMIAEQAGTVPSGPSKDASGQWIGPSVVAEYGYDSAPPLDLLLVPGGMGTMQELQNEALLSFLREQSKKSELVASVCSGSALLAKAGVLDGRRATCNKAYFGVLTLNGPNVQWAPKARWVEDGRFFTSSGVSAGTDMALAIIAKRFGEETARAIAKGTEYVWNSDADNDPFAVTPRV